MKKPHVWSLLILSTTAMANPPASPPAAPGRILTPAQLMHARNNFRLANQRLATANTNLLAVCDNQEKRLQNISKTLQGSGDVAGLISQYEVQRAEQVAGRGPFLLDQRADLRDAARLEFIEKKQGQPDKKRGILAAYAVIIDQLTRKVAASARLSELNTKKTDLGTALSSLQTEINNELSAYNTWNTAAAQALVESARDKRLLGSSLSTAESEALNYEEKHQQFVVNSDLLKVSLEAEKLFFEEEIADLSATPPTVSGLAVRNSELELKRSDLVDLRREIVRNRDRIRGYDGRIDDIDRQLLRLRGASGLTIDPICAKIKPPAQN